MADLNKYLEQLQGFDVNDIDWDKMGVWPVPARVAVCLLLVVLILVGCHFLVVKDKNAELEREKSSEVSLRRSFEVKAFEAANLERYRKQMEEMSGTIDALVSRLPVDIELPGLLDDFSDKAEEARVTIVALTPMREIPTNFHIERPINITVTGGYHEFATFVSGIAGMPRIVTLHDFSISKGTVGDLLQMDITAKTYRYKSDGE